jgi:DNA primase
MFPIRDLRQRTIAFGGRILGDGIPKYLNSPETPLFSKGRSLYALDRAREAAGHANRLIIVEGYFDAIALHQAGIRHVAATLGTALTLEHVRMIRRFVSNVTLLFDPDAAGIRAALRTLDVFVDSGIGVTVVSLPDGHDPDTYVRAQGADAFAALEQRAPALLDFAVDHSLATAASGSLEDRIRSVDEILRILQKTGNRIAKEECTRRVAERLGISQVRLIERYPELLERKVPAPRRAVGAPSTAQLRRPPEEWDLVCLLLQGKLTAGQLTLMQPEDFSLPACRVIVAIALQHRDDDGRVRLRAVLDAALEDPVCAAAATELSVGDRHFDDAAAHAQGCLETLLRKRHERRFSELIAKLRAAEQEGRMDDARELNAEVNELRLRKGAFSSVRSV